MKMFCRLKGRDGLTFFDPLMVEAITDIDKDSCIIYLINDVHIMVRVSAREAAECIMQSLDKANTAMHQNEIQNLLDMKNQIMREDLDD